MGLDDRMRNAMRSERHDVGTPPAAEELRQRARRRVRRRTQLGAAVMAVVIGSSVLAITRDAKHTKREPAAVRASGGRVGRTTGKFAIALSAGKPAASIENAIAVAKGDRLDNSAIASVLDRLPPFKTSDDTVPFKRPAVSLPRPRAGATIDRSFGRAPRPKPQPTDSGPLRVLRYQPVGDVDIAPDLSVTFSQPMVPLATLAQLDQSHIPVRVTPALEGRWRWIGVRTVRFEFTGAVDRLPMATSYSVEVPAGTTSQSGRKLATAVRWSFRTPPPKVLTFAPENVTVDTTPVFIATFDQRVDPAAVLKTTSLTVNGTKTSIRGATTAEVIANDEVHQISKDAPEGRWVAFRPTRPLPRGAALRISIGPGTPSAEGPRTTPTASNYSATTYSALAVTDTTCGYGEGCRPGSGFTITFNNALDAKKFDSETVTVAPAVSASIGVAGNVLTVNAATKANTRYTVRIPASLRDEFGQTLGATQTKSFDVGEATPTLIPFSRQLTTTDPSTTKPSVSVTSVGHATLDVEVYAVDPSRWLDYQKLRERWGSDQQAQLPFPRLSKTTVAVDGGGKQLTESTIDLSADLHAKTGHLVVVVSPTRRFPKDSELYWQNRPTITWVQVTSIAVDAFAGRDDLITWATSLRDGSPLAGVRVHLGGTANDAVSDSDGLARVRLARARYLTATMGSDIAILPADSEYEWNRAPAGDSVTGFAFDSSGIYRPGENVDVKGWFRRVRTSSDSAVGLLTAARTATWVARDAFGNELGKGTVNLNASSGFALRIKVPSGAALGTGQLQVTVKDAGIGGIASLAFDIQEFRRPEFEAVTRTESAGPYVLRKPLTVAAVGQYFSGGVLPNAPVVWQVSSSSTTYSPPNWSQFSFGVTRPYWMDDRGFEGIGGGVALPSRFAGGFSAPPCCFPQPEQKAVTYKGVTDATGTHYLQLDFNGETPDLPLTVSANASVTDVNRQSFASTLELLVHPSTLYVGIRSTRQYVREGEPIDVEAIVTNIDGAAVAGRTVHITVTRVESRFVNGQWVENDVDPKHCDTTSSKKPVSCSVKAGIGGQYKVSAVVSDDAGGKNRSELTRWVSGADSVPTRDVAQESAIVVPDRELYRPGDTAQLLVIAPFADASGLMTISANGTTTTQRFTVEQGSAVVKVPITDSYTRGLTVQVDLAGQAPRLRDDGSKDSKLPSRPAFATATLPLHVDPVEQRLTVSAVARQRVTEPGATDTVDVSVKGGDGSAVAGADVAVVVVDEAVLSLTGYKLADPIAAIYTEQTNERSADYLRNSLLLANPAVFGARHEATSTPTTVGLAGGGQSPYRALQLNSANAPSTAFGSPAGASATADSIRVTPQEVRVRTNFNALALFSPSLTTDAAGVAHATFHLPDNLTRYRVMAIAADHKDRFGSGESALTARIPLQIRPSPPRFANFGDRFELPVVVQNQTDKAVTADVVLEASNLSLTGAHGQRVDVPANDRVEVRFPVKTDAAGTVRYRVSATDGSHFDSATGEFPVYTPVTTEAFATYGVVDNGVIAQPLQTPTGVVPQFGGLEIDTSSTAMQALTDAVVYLEDYEYESADAYASRIVALTSLRGVFAAFGGRGVPSAAQVDARIRSDIKALEALQNDDGGFSTWTRGGEPQPYVSVQATEALVLARLAGFAVSEPARRGALDYLRNIESKFPSYWGQQERHSVSAYALSVRNRAGGRDSAKADALYRSDPGLTLDALAWLWPIVKDPAIDSEIARTIANRAHETPGAATFSSGYDDGAYLVLASDRRTDGIVLDALITKQPTSDLIPKVVAGLIGNQVQGRWNNIQENGFILVALQRYFATYEAQTPAFVARVWLGDTYAAEHSFQGRSIDRQHTLVPMTALKGDPDVVLQKAGSGRLYYRLGLRYAPADLALPARDEGFVVDRVYEAVNDPNDVRRDADGTWHIKPGAMVRVRMSIVADTNHTNMALVDAVPAGLEPLNPALAASPRPPTEHRPDDPQAARLPTWYGSTWFDHENLRDDRVEAFSAYLYGGTYDYTYIARATTIGSFVVPPAKAEEIYAPEVFGRTASDRVVVG